VALVPSSTEPLPEELPSGLFKINNTTYLGDRANADDVAFMLRMCPSRSKQPSRPSGGKQVPLHCFYNEVQSRGGWNVVGVR
jgi:hypothetical protein